VGSGEGRAEVGRGGDRKRQQRRGKEKILERHMFRRREEWTE
jgi:hypothetical protein